MTSELNQSMRDRDYHHRKAIKSQSCHHWSMYKKLKVYVNKQVAKCKSEYYLNLINENKNNSGRLCKTLNDVIARKNVSIPSSFKTDGVTYTEPKSIAEAFNLYFTTIGSKLADLLKAKLENN